MESDAKAEHRSQHQGAHSLAIPWYQDNGKVVGCLGGKQVGGKSGSAAYCVSGASAFITPTTTMGYNSWLPSVAARYRVQRTWSVYAQFGEGSSIPPSSVFDVPNAAVEAPPKPTLAKTYQAGAVLKFNRWTLDVDGYYIHFQNPYSSVNDPNNFSEPVYILTGPSNTKGIEGEGNIAAGHGVSLYAGTYSAMSTRTRVCGWRLLRVILKPRA